MGLLSVGTPLDWNDVVPYCGLVRTNGIEQFLEIYRKLLQRACDNLLWGDELEYMVVGFDHAARTVRLSLQNTTLHSLVEQPNTDASWNPEYARFMLEGTPRQPYGCEFKDFMCVEDNMRHRHFLIIIGLNSLIKGHSCIILDVP
jgi:glutamate--cysteine ligase catalytic subunit